MDRSGKCLCGACRYEVSGEPLQITICHCTFCQRATGSMFLKEPIFETGQLNVVRGTHAQHTITSRGSGKKVHIHFCDACGTKLYLSFERFEGIVGLFAGTLDKPDSIPLSAENTFYIFLDDAQPGTVIPAGFKCYRQHQFTNDGQPNEAIVFDTPHTVGEAQAH